MDEPVISLVYRLRVRRELVEDLFDGVVHELVYSVRLGPSRQPARPRATPGELAPGYVDEVDHQRSFFELVDVRLRPAYT